MSENDVLEAINHVQQRCEYAGAKGVAVIDLAFEAHQPLLPPKWDLADAVPQGLRLEDIQAKVTTAVQTLRTQMGIDVETLARAQGTPTTSKTIEWGFELGD